MRTLDNIFDRSTRETREAEAGRILWEYAPDRFQRDRGTVIVHNGGTVSRLVAEVARARDGDEVIFYRSPRGTEFLIGLVVSLVLSGISFGIQALTAPSLRTRKEGLEESATYGFDAIQNTVRPGTKIPLIYGTHRVGGHVLQQFQRQARVGDSKGGELHTLLGLGLGPISDVSDIRVDGNPFQDFGSSVQIETRLGANHQKALAGFHEVVTQSPQDRALVASAPPLEFTTSTEVDLFELVLRFSGGLFRAGDRGQILQKSVTVKVEHREVGTTTWKMTGPKPREITERTANAFDSFFRSPLLDRARYEIRVTRMTPDDTTVTGVSQVSVLALNEIKDEVLTYPGIALLAIRQLPTNQVSGRPPTYSALVKGRVVRVYTTPTTYTEEWSDNPAWCLLDLMTSTKGGLGAYISISQVDIQSFIDLAAWADELVAKDSNGVLEKRARLNLVLDGSLSPIQAIKQISTTAQAFPIFRGNKWVVRPDRAEEPVQFFSMGRIHRDSFGVSIDTRADRPNYFSGEFWNEEANYDQDFIPREDPTLLQDDNQVPETVNLVGSTNPSQVNRLLNLYMLSNRLLRRVVEFEVGAEAIVCEAGDVIKIAHDVPGWGYSGKLRQVVSQFEVILDRMVTIEAGKTYELTVIHDSDQIDVVSVTNLVAETTNRLLLSGDFTVPIKDGLDYSFGEVTKSTVLYRVRSITKGLEPYKRRIRAREYNAAVYGTDLTVLPAPSSSRLPDPSLIPDPVRDLRLQERQAYAEDGTLSVAIDVHFTLPAVPNVRAQVFWREKGLAAWEPVATVDAGYASITENVEAPGKTYEVSVVTLAQNGQRRHPDDGVRAEITTRGTTRQPEKVVDFRADRTPTGLIFTWSPLDPARNFDLDFYELRHGSIWETAVLVGRTKNTFLETTAFVKGQQTYLIKGVNTAGKESAQAAALVIQVAGRIGENIILTRAEEPSWSGARQNFDVDSGKLVLDTQSSIVAWRAQQQPVGRTRAILYPGGYGVGFRVTGIYTTPIFTVTSGGTPARCLVGTILSVNQIDLTLYWSAPGVADKSWLSDFAQSRAWATAPEGKVRVKIEMRFSTTGTADSDFGPWAERAQNIEVTLRHAQARITVEVLDPAFTTEITKFNMIFDVPDVTDSGSVSTSATGTVGVTYAKSFNAAPKISAFVIGATAGDEIFTSSETSTGFQVEVKNGGTRVVRTVHWIVNGF